NKKTFKKVKDTLNEYKPKDSAVYEENFETYIRELDDLELFAASRISEIPEDSRILVTPHDAFGYLADSYDLEVHAPQGFSTDSVVSNNEIQKTAELSRQNT